MSEIQMQNEGFCVKILYTSQAASYDGSLNNHWSINLVVVVVVVVFGARPLFLRFSVPLSAQLEYGVSFKTHR